MNRLKDYTKAKSFNALAEILGLSSSNFASLKKRNSVPYDKILEFSRSHNVSIDWLLTGEGQMFKRGEVVEDNVVNIKTRQIAELIASLDEQQQAEIFVVIEGKKREKELANKAMRLENTIQQMQKQMQRMAAA